MAAERVVLDTNVFISAVNSPAGKPSQCLQRVLDNAALVMAQSRVHEVESRLARPRFSRYVSTARRRAFIDDLKSAALIVNLTGTLRACRDPDWLIEIEVDAIVTG
jgi:uncharacterized protein